MRKEKHQIQKATWEENVMGNGAKKLSATVPQIWWNEGEGTGLQKGFGF